MGRHDTGEGRRGIAPWLIVSAVVAVLAVAATVIFLVAVNRDSDAADCTSAAVLPVAASTDVGSAVTAAAKAFDATEPIARSACISTRVTVAAGAAIADGLIDGWRGGESPPPALWIADSTADVDRVDKTNAALTAGHSDKTLATSPVVLAVHTADAGALAATAWKDLPTVADGSSGATTRPAGGRFLLAVPDPASNPASEQALESIVAGASGTAPVTAAAVKGQNDQLQQLAGAQPTNPPATTAAALSKLADGTKDFSIVPVFESGLAGASGSGLNRLTAVYPKGVTAVLDVLSIPLTATWVSPAQTDAAAAFSSFLDGPDGRKILAGKGFRVNGEKPTSVAAKIDFTAAVTPLVAAPPIVSRALAAAFDADGGASTSAGQPSDPTSAQTSARTGTDTGTATSSASGTGSTTATRDTATTGTGTSTSTTTSGTDSTSTSPSPAGAPVVTFVLDDSAQMATDDAGQSRTEWLRAAVEAAMRSHPAADMGLWRVTTTTGSAGFVQEVTTGSLSGQVGGTTRTSALTTALDGFTSAGDCWLYGAIRAAYPDAATKAVAGRPNIVIVVTASADATPDLPRNEVVAAVAAAAGSGVQLAMLGLSDEVNAEAMTEIAAAGNGSYQRVTGQGLQDAIDSLLG